MCIKDSLFSVFEMSLFNFNKCLKVFNLMFDLMASPMPYAKAYGITRRNWISSCLSFTSKIPFDIIVEYNFLSCYSTLGRHLT